MKKKAKKNLSAENSEPTENDLAEKIRKAAKGLYYISETDAKITLFDGGQGETVSAAEVLSRIKKDANTPIEQRNFDELFERLTKIHDWFGDEEKKTAAKFAVLRDLLKQNLRDLAVFKVGKIELDVYIVGLDAENEMLGVKTKAVET